MFLVFWLHLILQKRRKELTAVQVNRVMVEIPVVVATSRIGVSHFCVANNVSGRKMTFNRYVMSTRK